MFDWFRDNGPKATVEDVMNLPSPRGDSRKMRFVDFTPEVYEEMRNRRHGKEWRQAPRDRGD